jgi:hypothetical protein
MRTRFTPLGATGTNAGKANRTKQLLAIAAGDTTGQARAMFLDLELKDGERGKNQTFNLLIKSHGMRPREIASQASENKDLS